jgi:hypothetical protein
MLTVACVRLWPIAETLSAAPRLMAGTPGHQPRAILAAITGLLAVKDGDIELRGSFYVGAAFLAIAALGGSERRALRGMALVIVFVWLAAGYARKPALFALLRELPVFAALRYPERFLWLGVLFASEPAAHAFARVPLVGEGKRWRVAVWLVLSAGLGWTLLGEISAFHSVAAARQLGAITPTPAAEFRQARGNRWLASHFEAMGVGSLSCWETHPVAQSPLLRADLPAEEYLNDTSRDAGTVKRVAWSPNHVTIHATLTRPARVLVNQNWHPGWHASLGTVVSNEGLLAVDLPSGDSVVTLSFRPWSTMAGAGVSLTALAMLALLGWRARRSGALLSRGSWKGTSTCVLLPWLVAGVAYARSPDPRWLPAPPRNANGTPALVDVANEAHLPATPVGADFSLPVRVEAGRVQGPDQLDTLLLEIYLRRTGAVPRATTVFVHLVRREGQPEAPKGRESFYNADHQVVGGSFYLSDAPEGRVVHDAIGVHLKEPARGVWDVYVAFGHVSGQLGRAKVTSPGQATVSDNRVKIGWFQIE